MYGSPAERLRLLLCLLDDIPWTELSNCFHTRPGRSLHNAYSTLTMSSLWAITSQST